MFRPIAVFIGLRYTRANRRHHFISFISLMSILGIAFGVTALITILSVLNGFDREIKKNLFSMISPVTINSLDGHIKNWQKIQKQIEISPGITAVAPFINSQALLQNSNMTQPVMIIGIIPSLEKKMNALAYKMKQGQLSDLKANRLGIILSEDSAKHLGLILGDELMVMTAKGTLSYEKINAHFQKFIVTGIFHSGGGSGGASYDAKLAFIHLNDAQKILGLGSSISAFHATVEDLYAAPKISQQLENELFPLVATNWTNQLGDFFENIKLMKTIMFFIFILIIVVAAFNLIGTLIMVVNNKQPEIAILRTMGATPKMIMAIFVIQGGIIGFFGILLGIIGGVTLAWNVTTIANLIQAVFHVQLVSANVYFVNYLPSELQWSDVWHISLVTFALSLLATLRPAWNASRTETVEALRDE